MLLLYCIAIWGPVGLLEQSNSVPSPLPPGKEILIGIAPKGGDQNEEQSKTMSHNEELKEVERLHLERKKNLKNCNM